VPGVEYTFVMVRVSALARDTEVQGKLTMRVRKDEPTDSFLGFMPALKLYAQGRTPHEAERLMEKAVTLYLETAIQDGQLSDILLVRGFRRLSGGEKPSEQHLTIRRPSAEPKTDPERGMELEFAGAS
jgi:predicted RNase H-like HicB family nuclease